MSKTSKPTTFKSKNFQIVPQDIGYWNLFEGILFIRAYTKGEIRELHTLLGKVLESKKK